MTLDEWLCQTLHLELGQLVWFWQCGLHPSRVTLAICSSCYRLKLGTLDTGWSMHVCLIEVFHAWKFWASEISHGVHGTLSIGVYATLLQTIACRFVEGMLGEKVSTQPSFLCKLVL